MLYDIHIYSFCTDTLYLEALATMQGELQCPFLQPCDVDKFGRYQVNQTDNATESNQPAINLLHATAKTFARRNAGVAFGNRSIHTAEVFLPFSSAV